MHKLLYSFTMVLVLLTSAVAMAAEKPAEISSVVKADAPYGSGRLSWFFFPVYDAQLWTDSSRWSYDAPFALSVTYSMSLSKQDLVDSTLKEILRQHEPAPSAMQSYKALLSKAYDNVKEGDRITAIYTASGGIVLYLNGNKKVESNDGAFAKSFFDIWLSDKTSEPALRRQLLKTSS